MNQTRAEILEDYLEIRLLSEVLRPFHLPKHAVIRATFSGYNGTGAQFDSMQSRIKQLRGRRQNVQKIGLQKELQIRARNRLQKLFKAEPSDRRRLTIHYSSKNVGGMREKRNTSVGCPWDFRITIGPLWYRRVWLELYDKAERHLSSWIVLKAEPVRVNIKHIRLFEVRVISEANGQLKSAYVAQTISPLRSTCIGDTAASAVTKAQTELNRELDKMLVKGTSND